MQKVKCTYLVFFCDIPRKRHEQQLVNVARETGLSPLQPITPAFLLCHSRWKGNKRIIQTLLIFKQLKHHFLLNRGHKCSVGNDFLLALKRESYTTVTCL